MIDRLGNCPTCNTSWKGPEVIAVLGNLQALRYLSEQEIKNMASYYGWTPTNHACFSKVTVYEIKGIVHFVCHNSECRNVFNAVTGEVYGSLYDLYNHIKEPSATVAETAFINPPIELPKDVKEIIQEVHNPSPKAVSNDTRRSFSSFGAFLQQGKRETGQGLSTSGTPTDH